MLGREVRPCREEPDESNRNYGISIGHNDTDNVMRDNDVRNSGKVGILFRDHPQGKDFWPNRNRIESNRIIDSGGEDGIAIDVKGKTRDIQIVGNELRETRARCAGPAFASRPRRARSSWPTTVSMALQEKSSIFVPPVEPDRPGRDKAGSPQRAQSRIR